LGPLGPPRPQVKLSLFAPKRSYFVSNEACQLQAIAMSAGKKCSKSGAQRLKELGLRKDSKAYKEFKYGKDPAAVRKKSNDKYKLKRKLRATARD